MRNALVIGCGALANELVELTRRAGLPAMDLACLPASLHNRPEQIPARVAARIRRARDEGYERIFVAYADCGTGGLLDRMLETEPAAAGVTRLEGAHCYEVYAGRAAFASLHDAEPGTFYLTDYLVRNFDRLVVRGLGLDRHPELLPLYFGNYRRLVYLAQTDDADLSARAAAAAARLGGLAFERRVVGLGELAPAEAAFGTAASTMRSAVHAAADDSQSRNPSESLGRARTGGASNEFLDCPPRFRAAEDPIGARMAAVRREDHRVLTASQRRPRNRPDRTADRPSRRRIVTVSQREATAPPRSGAAA
jgi:hypothetical protein